MNRYKILIFIFSVIALLACVSFFFPKDGVPFMGRILFFPTIEEVLVRDKSLTANEKLAIVEEGIRMKQITDSINVAKEQARQDSIRFYTDFFTNHSARFYLPNNDFSFFDALFEELENCRKDTSIVHIIHYGDSQIEEDRISSYIRQSLQEMFGGIGAGLLPIMQPIPSASVSQFATGNMTRYILAGQHRSDAPSNRYGILCQFATVAGSGTINIRSQNYSRTLDNVKRWNRVRLFVNRNSTPFAATLSYGKYSKTKRIDVSKNSPTTLFWELPDSTKSITISVSGTAELSAVSLDGAYGVNVDNVPIRGSSGTFFSKIDESTIIPVAEELNVRLILLEFGGNMMPVINKNNLSGYMDKLSKQIQYLQKVCPKAKVVLIGPADMSKRIKGNLQTYPMLPVLVDSMKNMAVENGAGFWNMYEVMGGENSMIQWVRSRPSLAAPDYIHFTPRGANKIAEMLFESLTNYYEFYKMHKKNE